MPYFELTDEDHAALSDEVKAKLKTYVPEDTTGLKTKANELLAETKKQKADIAGLQADLKAANLNKDQDGGDAEKVQLQLNDALNKLEEANGKYKQLEESGRAEKVKSEAARLAAELTKDTGRADLLAGQLSSRLTIDGDKFTVLDSNGNATISSVDELTAEIKKNYPFLVDGAGAAGGGAIGSGGGAAVKPFKEMSFTERAQLANSDPAKYKELSGAQ